MTLDLAFTLKIVSFDGWQSLIPRSIEKQFLSKHFYQNLAQHANN